MLAPDLAKYSEDQPRDDHGRWTEGGSTAPTEISLQGVAPALLPSVREATSAFRERFPTMPFAVTVQTLEDPTTLAETTGNTVTLNKAWFSDARAWQLGEAEDRAHGFTVDPSVRGTVLHELGHTLDVGASEDLYAQPGGVIDGVPAAIEKAISGYSTMNPAENFAESFCAWFEGKQSDAPQVRAMEAYMRDNWPSAISKAAGGSLAFADAARRVLADGFKAAYDAGFIDANADDEGYDPETNSSYEKALDEALDEPTDDIEDDLPVLAATIIGGAISFRMLSAWLGGMAARLGGLYQVGFEDGLSGQEGSIARITWITEEDGIVCELCDGRNGQVWYGDQEHPYPGEGTFGEQCAGGPHCRCSLEYELVPVEQAPIDVSFPTTPGDEEDYAAAAVPDLTKLTLAELLSLRVLKYSEDQPRDDHGRWTDGGEFAEMPVPSAGSQAYRDSQVHFLAKAWGNGMSTQWRAALASGTGGDRPTVTQVVNAPNYTAASDLLAAANSSPPTTYLLYRGVGLGSVARGDPKGEYGKFQAAFQPGAQVPMNLSSWSRDDSVAKQFASNSYGTAEIPAGDPFGLDVPAHQVIFEVAAGARAYDATYDIPQGPAYSEHLMAGQFEVLDVRHESLNLGSWRLGPGSTGKEITRDTVTLRQIATLDPGQLVGTKINKYDESEPRDEAGRWTAGGDENVHPGDWWRAWGRKPKDDAEAARAQGSWRDSLKSALGPLPTELDNVVRNMAYKSWADSFGAAKAMRAALATGTGDPVKGLYGRVLAAQIAKGDASANGTPIPELYRGLKDLSPEAVNQLMSLKVGDTIDLNVSSWVGSDSVARQFGHADSGLANASGYSTMVREWVPEAGWVQSQDTSFNSAIFALEGGSKAFDSALTNYSRDSKYEVREFMTDGRFMLTEAPRLEQLSYNEEMAPGHYLRDSEGQHVRLALRQVAVFTDPGSLIGSKVAA